MIIGININKIEAKRNDEIKEGKLSINSTPTVTGVSKKAIANIGTAVAIEFSFKSMYEPDAGEIKMYGEVLYKTDKAEDILKRWKKDEQLDPDVSVEVLNAVFTRCLTKAIGISEDLRLPPPVRFPKVAKEQPSEEYK